MGTRQSQIIFKPKCKQDNSIVASPLYLYYLTFVLYVKSVNYEWTSQNGHTFVILSSSLKRLFPYTSPSS